MSECVEGEWKNYIFKMGTPETYPLIIAHLKKVFFRDEPLTQLVGYFDESADRIDKYVLYLLNKDPGLSFYVEEKGTGKIAGVRVTCTKRKDDKEPEFDESPPNAKRKKVFTVLNEVSEKSNIFEKYSVDYYGYFVMTCVDPEFRGQGLVTEIYKRSIALLKAKGYPVCSGLFTSPFTKKAAENLKFEEIYFKRFVDYIDENGEPLLPGATPDQVCSCMALRLN